MPSSRRRASRNTGRPMVQSYDWARSFGSIGPDMTVAAFVQLAVAVPSTTLGETVRRIRGELVCHDQAVNGNVVLGAYIANVNVPAVNVEDPLGLGLNSDAWMLFESPRVQTFNVATTTYSKTITIDTKAMRKMPDGSSLRFVLAWTAGAGLALTRVNFQFSVLGSLTRA